MGFMNELFDEMMDIIEKAGNEDSQFLRVDHDTQQLEVKIWNWHDSHYQNSKIKKKDEA